MATKILAKGIVARLFAGILAIGSNGFCVLGGDYALAQLAPQVDQAGAVAALDRGKAAFNAGQPQAAEQAFRQAVDLDPSNVEANYRLGSLLLQRNAIQEGLGYLQRSVDLAPDNLSLRMSVGNFFEQYRQIPQALVHYRFVADKAPKSPEGIEAEKRLNLVLAKDYAAKGDLDTSLQILQSMAEEQPDDLRVLQHLGFAYFLARRFEPAIAVYQEVIERDPKSDTAYLNVANVYEQMGDYPHAIDALDKVAQLVPDGPKNVEARVRAGILRGFQASRQSEFEQALSFVEEALQLAPNHPVASALAGDIYRQLGKLDDAQRVWEQVLRVVPTNVDVRLKLATLFLDRNNFVDGIWELDRIMREAGTSPQAIQAAALVERLNQTFGNQVSEMRAIAANKNTFKSRLLLNPSDVEAQFNLGVILLQQGLLDEALLAFETVRTIDPGIARTYLNLARIYSQQAKYDQAADAMSTYVALETDTQQVEAQAPLYANILASQLYEREQFRPALAQYQRLLEMAPNDPAAHFYTGVILLRLGEMEESAREFEKVAELAPNHLGARQQLAYLYEQIGKEQEALTEYKRIALSTDDPAARENAEKRATALQRSLNGVTTSVGYSLSYDSNSNYSDRAPKEEYTGNLSLNLTYRYKYSEKFRLGLAWSPAYVTYHRGNYDFLNETYNPFVTYGDPTDLYTVRYTFNKLSGVLLEQSVNETQTFSVDRNWDYARNEKLGATFSIRDYQAATSNLFDTTTYTFSGTFSRNLGRGYGDVFTASAAVSDNKTSNNRDAANNSVTLGYQGSKWLSGDLFVGFTANLSYTKYRYDDIYAVTSGLSETVRQNYYYSLSTSLNYRLNEAIRLYASLTYQKNDSNLPIFKCEAVSGGYVCQPLTSEDFIGVAVQSASLSDYDKALLNLGISVNF